MCFEPCEPTIVRILFRQAFTPTERISSLGCRHTCYVDCLDKWICSKLEAFFTASAEVIANRTYSPTCRRVFDPDATTIVRPLNDMQRLTNRSDENSAKRRERIEIVYREKNP